MDSNGSWRVIASKLENNTNAVVGRQIHGMVIAKSKSGPPKQRGMQHAGERRGDCRPPKSSISSIECEMSVEIARKIMQFEARDAARRDGEIGKKEGKIG